MKTALEIINETITEYSDRSKRAIDGDGEDPNIQPACQYINHCGNRCAVGRCLTPDNGYESCGGYVGILATECGGLDSILKEEYRGHSVEFWADLQRLHDKNVHWGPNGLTEAGQAHVDLLILRYVTPSAPQG